MLQLPASQSNCFRPLAPFNHWCGCLPHSSAYSDLAIYSGQLWECVVLVCKMGAQVGPPTIWFWCKPARPTPAATTTKTASVSITSRLLDKHAPIHWKKTCTVLAAAATYLEISGVLLVICEWKITKCTADALCCVYLVGTMCYFVFSKWYMLFPMLDRVADGTLFVPNLWSMAAIIHSAVRKRLLRARNSFC